MRLVPRQLQRSGMTGDLPYYGGRFTPAQAYAAQHASAPAPPEAAPAATPAKSASEQLAMLDEMRVQGMVTDDEYATLRERIGS